MRCHPSSRSLYRPHSHFWYLILSSLNPQIGGCCTIGTNHISDREKRHIWSKPWHKSSFVFFANRYIAVANNVITLILSHNTSLSPQLVIGLRRVDCSTHLQFRACHKSEFFHQVMIILTQIIVCCESYRHYLNCDSNYCLVIVSLRVYALYLCSKRILAFLGVLAFVLSGIIGVCLLLRLLAHS